jgi:hypothetical protein
MSIAHQPTPTTIRTDFGPFFNSMEDSCSI